MRATASGRRRLGAAACGLLFLLLGAQGFVMPSTPARAPAPGLVSAARRPLAPLPTTAPQASGVVAPSQRRGVPLWIKGQPLEEEKSETPAEMVQSFAATQGVDARQLNFLLNLAFIAVVAATVLTKVALVDLDFWRGWTPLEIFFRIPLDNWDGYMHVLTDHPVIVKGVTSCSVYTIGDWVAQMYEGKTLGEIDRGRVARSAVAGLIGHGPLSHLWYGVSESFFDFLGWEGWWTTFPKIGVDQLVWSPIWNGCYIALLGLMKRESLPEIWHTVRSTSFSLITSGLKLWPLAHVVTYGVIPVENRLLWVDLVEILWVTILSREAAHADASKEEAAATAEASAGADGAGEPLVLAATAAAAEEPAAPMVPPASTTGTSSGSEPVTTAFAAMDQQLAPVPVQMAAPEDGSRLP